jgi:hypothetical protein
MNRRILVGLATLLVTGTVLSAQTRLPWYVVGSGGNVGAVSGQRALSGTIGQAIIGIVATTNGSRLSQGFWLPLNDTLVGVDEGTENYSLANDVQNYPNPFSSITNIRFTNPIEGSVTVNVYDLTGNLVRTLRAELSLAGGQEIVFDGLTENGAPLGSGTYIYEVRGTGLDGRPFLRVQRMTILR